MFTHVKNSLGQSLLEVTIVIGLVVIVLTAVASLVIHGLEVSQVAQNQAQASKLAREGIEIVRSIRDTKGTVAGPGSVCDWGSTFWGNSAVTGSGSVNYFRINHMAGSFNCNGGPAVPTTNPWLGNVTSSTYEQVQVGTTSTQFNRQIEIDGNGNASQVQVKSTVTWTDYSGPHSTSVVTILANI